MTLRVLLEGKRCVGVEYEKDGKVVQARGARDHPVGGRRRQPADPRALRHRPARAAEAARHRGEARAAGGRREFPRPHQRPHRLAGEGPAASPTITWRAASARSTQMMKYLATGGGFMSLPSAPLLAFLRTRPELATPDVQMHLVPYSIKDPKTRKLQDFPSMTISVYQLRPESLGSIHIRSADPKAQPAIRFNFLADPIDQAAMVDGFRMIRRIVDAHADGSAIAARSIRPARASRATTRSSTRSATTRRPPITRSAPAAWARRAEHRGRRQAQGARPRGPAHRRRLDLPDHAVGQHQRAVDHGGREDGGYPESGLITV